MESMVNISSPFDCAITYMYTYEDCGRGIKGEKSDRSVIFLHIYVHFTWYTLIFFLHMYAYMYKKKLFYLFDFDISIL